MVRARCKRFRSPPDKSPTFGGYQLTFEGCGVIIGAVTPDTASTTVGL